MTRQQATVGGGTGVGSTFALSSLLTEWRATFLSDGLYSQRFTVLFSGRLARFPELTLNLGLAGTSKTGT